MTYSDVTQPDIASPLRDIQNNFDPISQITETLRKHSLASFVFSVIIPGLARTSRKLNNRDVNFEIQQLYHNTSAFCFHVFLKFAMTHKNLLSHLRHFFGFYCTHVAVCSITTLTGKIKKDDIYFEFFVVPSTSTGIC